MAHEFETDTLQLRFGQSTLNPPPIFNQEFWLSFQTAFVSAAAEVLSIPRADLEGTYRSPWENSIDGGLIIYDRVPGGAGYVERIVESLPQILERTLERTHNCDTPLCDPDGSCYTCLRSYGNQFYWDRLKRRAVFEWLGGIIGERKQEPSNREKQEGVVADEWKELLAYCDPRSQKLIADCARSGRARPVVGYEITDQRGAVCAEAELAWPKDLVAVLYPSKANTKRAFKEAGWTVFSINGSSFAILENLRKQ